MDPKEQECLFRLHLSGKEKSTPPWLQNHWLHAKERTSNADHPVICQAKIRVKLSKSPIQLAQKVKLHHHCLFRNLYNCSRGGKTNTCLKLQTEKLFVFHEQRLLV
ncbi:hypothetical protein A4A49_27035 [Nicotiana attenuata]|uniref:Uncharacterized protein n=1 Tax=Nicotiana attenuata TaxID=49451 RepID=A0A1J6IAC6_NICAT|nr:hypothetical protein A4A49_27035 [Nicotiana attenuata]